MNQAEIIKLAREAGPLIVTPFDEWCLRFAALVAAAEREECAKLFESHWREDWKDQQCAEAVRARGQAWPTTKSSS
jgi:hypothetical protein